MTTTTARFNGFDIATVPAGVHDTEAGPVARFSLVFRPNGLMNAFAIEESLRDTGPSGSLFDFFDVNKSLQGADILVPKTGAAASDVGAPHTWLVQDIPEDQLEKLKGLSKSEAEKFLWDTDLPVTGKSVAETMVDRLARWLKTLPARLHQEALQTSALITAAENLPDITPEPDDTPVICHQIEVDGKVYDFPCDLGSLLEEARQRTGTRAVFPDSVDDDALANVMILTPPDWYKPLPTKEVSEPWPQEQGVKSEAQHVWEALFPGDSLRDLARALLFPDNPTGRRTAKQLHSNSVGRATLKTDYAGAMAAGLAQVKSAELLAALEAATALTDKDSQRDAPGFGTGLSAGDLVGSIHGRLLGSVRSYDISVPREARDYIDAKFSTEFVPQALPDTDEGRALGRRAELLAADVPKLRLDFPEKTAAEADEAANGPGPWRLGRTERQNIAERRRDATLNSLLRDTDAHYTSLGYNGASRAASKGSLRPGFGQVVMDRTSDDLDRFVRAATKARDAWMNAFAGEAPDQEKLALGENPSVMEAALFGAAEALAEDGELALSDDVETLNPPGKRTGVEGFADALAGSKSAWRNGRGLVRDKDPGDAAAEDALRRFQEIYAHPVLAEKMGFVRDYEVPLEALEANAEGEVFFRLGASRGILGQHTQTACVLNRSARGALAFRPAGMEEWFKKSRDPIEGLRDLTERRYDGPRYTLQIMDEQQMLRGVELASKASTDQFLSGEAGIEIDDHLPQVRHYGIALMDLGRVDEETRAQAAAEVADVWTGAVPLLAYAENLTIGFRLDVGISQPGGRVAWIDAGDRDLDYPRLRDEAGGRPLGLSTRSREGFRGEIRHRSKGYVTAMNRYLDHPDAVDAAGKPIMEDEPADIVTPETLTVWQGRNISLPRRALEEEFIVQNWFAPMVDPADGPLPLEMDYYEPEPSKEDMIRTDLGLAGPTSGVPPLRQDVGYFFGVRPVFLNRGGPTLEDAYSYYDGKGQAKPIRLGASDEDAPLVFGRNEPIGAPELLLSDRRTGPAREPLYVAHAARDARRHGANSTYITQWPGNAVDSLVLRSEGGPEAGSLATDAIDVVERYVLPPRIDVTLAEVTGVQNALDAILVEDDVVQDDGTVIRGTKEVPRGLFDRGGRVRRIPWSGGFPVALGGEDLGEPEAPEVIDDPFDTGAESNRKATKRAELEKELQSARANDTTKVAAIESKLRDLDREASARGGVLTGKGGGQVVAHPYQPDPLANVLCVMPLRDGRPLLDAPVTLRAIKDGAWPDQDPCVIQLMRPGAEPLDGTTYDGPVVVGTGLTLRTGTTRRDFLRSRLPTVGIWLEDGAACELAMWFAPADGIYLANHGLIQMAKRSEALKANRFKSLRERENLFSEEDIELGKALGALLLKTPVRGLTVVRRVPLLNATRRPIKAPHFVPKDGAPELPFARIDLAPLIADEIQKEIQKEQGLSVKAATQAALDAWLQKHSLVDAASEPGATNVVFGGALGLDRPSSSSVRLEARWTEYPDDPPQPLRRDETDPLRRYMPLEPEAWTILDTTETPVENSADLRAQDVDLERTPLGVPRGLHHEFSDTKARRLDVRAVALSRHTTSFIDGSPGGVAFATPGPATKESLILRATARPNAPVLAEKMLPVFRYDRINLVSKGPSGPRRTGLQVERISKLRYFLKRPWYDAGYDQRLAVLLWDGALFDPDAVSYAEMPKKTPRDIPEALRSRVSIQGRDPKFEAASVGDFLTGRDFQNDLAEERMANLTIPGVSIPNTTRPADHLVSAALFEVELDRKRDLWLADIQMRAADSYFPFVRLSLAAAQHTSRALPGLELSQPIEGWGRVAPRRQAWVTLDWEDGAPKREARVIVNGGSYRQRDPGSALALFKSMVDAPWLQVTLLQRAPGLVGDGGWAPIIGKQPEPRQSGQAAPAGTDNLWDFKVNLPEAWFTDTSAEYALLLREYERVPVDADGPISNADDSALEVLETFATSEDGLSAIGRGRTTFGVVITLEELLRA